MRFQKHQTPRVVKAVVNRVKAAAINAKLIERLYNGGSFYSILLHMLDDGVGDLG